jgi:hypothetical protein
VKSDVEVSSIHCLKTTHVQLNYGNMGTTRAYISCNALKIKEIVKGLQIF